MTSAFSNRVHENLRASLAHAAMRAEELSRDISVWGQHAFLRWERQDEGQMMSLVIKEAPNPPVEYSVRAAEALHPVSATFDHIAWCAARPEARADAKLALRVTMPTVTEAERWPPRDFGKLFDPAVADVLRSFQPFATVAIGHSAMDEPLALLRALDNAAKHRSNHLIQVIVTLGMRIDGGARDVTHLPAKLWVEEKQPPFAATEGTVLFRTSPPADIDVSIPALTLAFSTEGRPDFLLHPDQLSRLIKDSQGIAEQLISTLSSAGV